MKYRGPSPKRMPKVGKVGVSTTPKLKLRGIPKLQPTAKIKGA